MSDRHSYAAFNEAGEVYAIGAADQPEDFRDFLAFLQEVGGGHWQKIERLACAEACCLHIKFLDRIGKTQPKAA